MLVFLLIILSTLIGSFYNVCIHRSIVGESIAYPPSRCPSCLKPLSAMDLIPILSFIHLLGRCRYCKVAIPLRYLIVEVITPILHLILYNSYGVSWRFISYMFFVGILIIISFIDIEHKIIPDKLIIIGLSLGVVLGIVGSTTRILDALLGLIVGGGSLSAIALASKKIINKEGMGGGDVKLLAMVGVFLGWRLTVLTLLFSIYIGGIFSIILLLLRFKERDEYIAFGPFISLASIIALLWGNDIIRWYLTILY